MIIQRPVIFGKRRGPRWPATRLREQIKVVEDRRQELEKTVVLMTVAANRIRIGSKNMDPVGLTAEIRLVSPGLKVELNERYELIVTSDVPLTVRELERVNEVLGFTLRT